MATIKINRSFEPVPAGVQELSIKDMGQEGDKYTITWVDDSGREVKSNFYASKSKSLGMFAWIAETILPYNAGATDLDPTEYIGKRVKVTVVHEEGMSQKTGAPVTWVNIDFKQGIEVLD